MYNISTVSSVSVEVVNKIKFEFSKKKKKKGLLFFSRQSAAVCQMILRRCMFWHLKKTAILAKQRKQQE